MLWVGFVGLSWVITSDTTLGTGLGGAFQIQGNAWLLCKHNNLKEHVCRSSTVSAACLEFHGCAFFRSIPPDK